MKALNKYLFILNFIFFSWALSGYSQDREQEFVPQLIAFIDLGASLSYSNQAAIISQTTTQLPRVTTGIDFRLNSDIRLRDRVRFAPTLQVFTRQGRGHERTNYSTGGAQQLIDDIAGDELVSLSRVAQNNAALFRLIKVEPELFADLQNAFGEVHRIRISRPRYINETQINATLPFVFGSQDRPQFFIGPRFSISPSQGFLDIAFQAGARRRRIDGDGQFQGDIRYGVEMTLRDSERVSIDGRPRKIAVFVDSVTNRVIGWAKIEIDIAQVLNMSDLNESDDALLVIRGGFQTFFGARGIFGLRFDAALSASFNDNTLAEDLVHGSTYVDDVPNVLFGVQAEANIGVAVRWGNDHTPRRVEEQCELRLDDGDNIYIDREQFETIMASRPAHNRYRCTQ